MGRRISWAFLKDDFSWKMYYLTVLVSFLIAGANNKFHQPVRDIFVVMVVICLEYGCLLVDVLTFHLEYSVLWKCSKDFIGGLLWFGPVAMQMKRTLEYRRKIWQHILQMFRHLGRECQKHQLISRTNRSVLSPLYLCLRKRRMMHLGRALWKLKNTVQKAYIPFDNSKTSTDIWTRNKEGLKES